MAEIVLYFLHSTPVFPIHMDVVFTLSIDEGVEAHISILNIAN